MTGHERAAPVSNVDPLDLDPVDPDAVHDDQEDTDHLARLDDPDVLRRVVELDEQDERYERRDR